MTYRTAVNDQDVTIETSTVCEPFRTMSLFFRRFSADYGCGGVETTGYLASRDALGSSQATRLFNASSFTPPYFPKREPVWTDDLSKGEFDALVQVYREQKQAFVKAARETCEKSFVSERVSGSSFVLNLLEAPSGFFDSSPSSFPETREFYGCRCAASHRSQLSKQEEDLLKNKKPSRLDCYVSGSLLLAWSSGEAPSQISLGEAWTASREAWFVARDEYEALKAELASLRALPAETLDGMSREEFARHNETLKTLQSKLWRPAPSMSSFNRLLASHGLLVFKIREFDEEAPGLFDDPDDEIDCGTWEPFEYPGSEES